MESNATSERSDTSMVDLGLQPCPKEGAKVDDSILESLRTEGNHSDDTCILKAGTSSQEDPKKAMGDGREEDEEEEDMQWKNLTSSDSDRGEPEAQGTWKEDVGKKFKSSESDSDRGEPEVQDPWTAESSAVESSAVESSAVESSVVESLAVESLVRESSTALENGGIVLSDGVNLQEETDVDIDQSRSKNDLAGSVCLQDDFQSFSNDKESSVESGSVRGEASVNETTTSFSQNDTKTTSESETCQTESDTSERSRSAPETSLSSSSLSGGDHSVGKRTKSWDTDLAVKGEEEANAVSGGACTADDSLSSWKDGSSDPCVSSKINDHAQNQNLTLHADDETVGNSVASHEPFSPWVDVSRLLADLRDCGVRGEQSGNTQEQELRSLIQRREDSHSRKQLKKLLRSGSWSPISTVRKVAWHLVCGYLHKLEKAFVYLQMEKEMFGDLENEDVPVLTWPQQSPQEEPLLTEYYLKAEGKNTAHKIVSVIGQLSPHITYSPGLLPLVDLFLHYMDAADCFSCVLTLLQSNNPAYLMQSRVAFEASKHVLRDLTKKYAKSAYVALVRSGINMDSVFDSWMSWIYSDLPFSYVVAVTDSYMMEGIKVLYRVVLAIIILFTKHTGHGRRGAASNNAGHSIGEFCRHLPVPPSKLLKVAFRIRGFSRRKILKLQHRHEGDITSGAVSLRPDMPRVSSALSMGELSIAASMAHPNTKMMGFHDVGSNVLTVDQLATIWNWLPARHSIYQPKLLFNSADDGTSLTTLYAHVENEPCSIIIIKTINGEVFGAFCAESWAERRNHSRPIGFFGTGETFLFTLVPERNKFEWVGVPDPHVPLSANMFQAGDQGSLLIGGGNGSGIQIDATMERCRTETCDTFDNPPLCPSMDFVPAAVEVFGLQ